MARNSITLNGKSSDTITGLLIQELPPISKPLMRTEVEEIDGRDGDIVTKLGFSAYDKEISVGLYGNFDINEIIAFFNSEGKVTFSNEPDKFYYYQILDEIDFERLVRFRTAKVKFHVQPFKYSASEEPEELGDGSTVSDEGTMLTLDGSAEAPLSEVTLKGDSYQKTISGANLYNFKDTVSVSPRYSTDEEGWITCTLDTAPSANSDLYYYTHNLDLLNSTQYAVVVEIKSVSGDGYLALYTRWTGHSEGQFTTEKMVPFSELSAGQTYIYTPTTTASFNYDVGLRSYVRFGAGQTGSITFRISVIADTSVTPESFEYLPYVGGIDSPNPDYPQDIQVVTGEQNIRICGKNLFDKDNPNVFNGYIGGSPVRLIGSSTDKVIYIPCKPNTNYSVTKGLSGTTAKNRFRLATTSEVPASGVSIYDYWNAGDGKTTTTHAITTGPDAKYLLAFIYTTDELTTFADMLETIQIEEGPTTSYEPYVGQSFEVNLHNDLYDRTAAVKEGNNLQNIAFATLVNPGTPYVFNVGNRAWAAVRLYDSTDNLTRTLGNTSETHMVAFTAGSDEVKARLSFYAGREVVVPEYNFTGVEFYKTEDTMELVRLGDYQDYLWFDGEKWYKHKAVGKYTFTGASSEPWVAGNLLTNTRDFRINDSAFLNAVATGENSILALVDKFTGIANGATVDAECFWFNQSGNLRIRVALSRMSGSEVLDFKTWLTNNYITVYYPLATPVDEEITNETLISQLNALAAASAYKGRTHIISTSGSADNLPHIVAATVLKDSSGEVINSGNTTSKPRLTIYGTGDITVSLNDMQLFQIALSDTGYITIDTAAMEAYKDSPGNLQNRLVTGDYSNFALKPGTNQIDFTGTVSKCIVENYSRWL